LKGIFGKDLSSDWERAEAANIRSMLKSGQKYIRGLYSGGTLAKEAVLILSGAGIRVKSNISSKQEESLSDPWRSEENTVVDLGEDMFTVGRPHPMIDYNLRNERILKEVEDKDTGVILLDVVLGYGSNRDPAGELEKVIPFAKKKAESEGRHIEFIASVTGTDMDIQDLKKQVDKLRDMGVRVLPTNASAVRVAALSVSPDLKFPPTAVIPPNTRHKKQVSSSHHKDTRHAESSHGADVAGLGGGHDKKSAFRHSLIFSQWPVVINMGLKSFYDDIKAQGAKAVHVQWKPPAGGKVSVIAAFDRLYLKSAVIEEANRNALERLNLSLPVLVDIQQAKDFIAGMKKNLILHAGPPIEYSKMCGPMKGAVQGALVFEGLAKDLEDADRLAASGQIEFAPCHHYNAVGPMAGVVSYSMWGFVVENKEFGNSAYCSLNEGLGKVLRFGANTPDVLARLKWMTDRLGPALKKAVRLAAENLSGKGDGINIKSIISQALLMGDECHNRNVAATNIFLKEILPYLLATDLDKSHIREVTDFISSNPHFFLNLSMASAKAAADSIKGLKNSSIMCAMARNGVEIGIRVAGTGDMWFTAPAGNPRGLYFPGFSEKDACPDLGDSTITETAGTGGFAMAGAPAIVKFVGGRPDDAVKYTMEMYEITAGKHSSFQIPALNFAGTPLGVDIRKVVDTGITPIINTGIAHREAGIGQIGAGILRADMKCFEDALLALDKAITAD
ncbi:MAG: DUF1116 domain-containing protein, partial [Thermoplasmata archaeon]